jgi:hypothetical protein
MNGFAGFHTSENDCPFLYEDLGMPAIAMQSRKVFEG